MRTSITLLGAGLLALAGFASVGATEIFHTRPAYCEPGYQIVEEVIYQEVVDKVCVRVPDVKKTVKWVYSQKAEDYCVPHCSARPKLLGGHGDCGATCGAAGGCDGCPDCGKVRTKCLLVKKQVTEECPSTKCVVRCTPRKVACTVYRKVPCGYVSPTLPCTAPAGQSVNFAPAAQPVAPVPAPATFLTPTTKDDDEAEPN